MRASLIPSIAVLFLGPPPSGSPQDAVLLRRELIPNSLDTYKMSMAIKQTITMPNGMTMPDVLMTITSDLAIKGGASLKDGKLPVTVTVSNYAIDTTMPIGADDLPTTLSVDALLDDRNNMTNLEYKGSDPKMREMYKQIAQMIQGVYSFPEKPVKKGDTWEVSTAPSPIFANRPLKFQLKFEGERTVNAQAMWVVTARESVPVDTDMSQMAGASRPETEGMTVKGKMEVIMEMLCEKNGRMYSMLSDIKTDLEVNSPQANGTIHVVGDAIQKMDLVK